MKSKNLIPDHQLLFRLSLPTVTILLPFSLLLSISGLSKFVKKVTMPKNSTAINTPTIIVVAGAKGQLGNLICDSLLSRARSEGRLVQVRGLVRKEGLHSGSVALDDQSAKASGQNLTIESVAYENHDDLKRVCAGAHCVVSALQGLRDVIVDVQLQLLKAAIAEKVQRFIPSDFAIDFTRLPEGSNRNFDLRLQFHKAADQLIRNTKSGIELTSVYQGAFTELLGSGRFLFDYKKRIISYIGSPDTIMELTTWKNTAEYTAAVALDLNPTPRSLYIAGKRLTPLEAAQIAKRVTGSDFRIKRMMSVRMLRLMIALIKFFKPEKNRTMPVWVLMQYAYCMAIGPTLPENLDNERYNGIEWTGIEDTVRQAFNELSRQQS